jgi:DNA-binding transcriptional ArsR family regulator
MLMTYHGFGWGRTDRRMSGHKGDGVLRVHFTGDDLLQVTFADEPSPLMELSLALATLQRNNDAEPELLSWRRQLRQDLPGLARVLLEIVPPTANGPLFLDPPSPDLDSGLDQVMITPRPFVESELHKVLDTRPSPSPWARDLIAHNGRAWKALYQSLRTAHDSVLRPDWDMLVTGFQWERAWRIQQLARLGVREMFASWAPRLRWRGTILEVDHPRDLDIVPTGRGIRLLPSLVWTGRPLIATQPQGPTLLLFPALACLPQLLAAPADNRLIALLGFTRAHVLSVLTHPCNTSEIARAVGISKSSASEHATVLRNAGLITTRRDGKSVLHTCTPTGLGLLSHRWTPALHHHRDRGPSA